MKNLPRRFYQFQFSVLLSNLSFRCLQLAIAWLILDKSREASTFALVISVSSGIEIASRLVFAWLGDRYDKLMIYRISIVANFAALFGLSALLLAGVYHVLVIALFLSLIGVTMGIRSPIGSSAIPLLVDTPQISKAVQIKNIVYSLGHVVGPGLAGVLIAMNGTSSALVAGCVLIFLSALLISRVSSAHSANSSEDDSAKEPSLAWWAETYQGIKLVYGVKAEFFLAIVALTINLCLFPFFTILIPVLVKETLQLDAWYIGLLDGAFSVGILVGSAYYVDYMKTKIGKMHSAALGIVLLAAAMLACATISNLYLVAPIMFVGGIGLMLFNINVSVPRLIATPERFKNRMVASVLFLSSIVNPLGTFASGIL